MQRRRRQRPRRTRVSDPTYALGRSDDEHARLTEQANFLRPLTERFFRHAGIARGMQVLRWLANTLRSVAPMARKFGISLEAVGDLDTLAQRLTSEGASGTRSFWSPPYVGAVVRVPAR
jgi:hypothetical protein